MWIRYPTASLGASAAQIVGTPCRHTLSAHLVGTCRQLCCARHSEFLYPQTVLQFPNLCLRVQMCEGCPVGRYESQRTACLTCPGAWPQLTSSVPLYTSALHPIAKKHMYALKDLAQPQVCGCGWLACRHPQAGCGAHVACATRLRLRQAFSRTLRSQKQ